MADRPRDESAISRGVTLRLNFRSQGYGSAYIYGPLDRGMFILQLDAGSFYTKKLCSRLY